MKFLQTPNISSLGLMSDLFKALTRKCNFFNNSFFWHFMPQFFYTNVTSHIALWYVMVSKLGNLCTWIKSQHTLRFPIFIKISFIELYTLPGIYFPFIDIIGCKPPCSHKNCLLSIKKGLFFYILVFLILYGHKGLLR